MVKRVFLFLFVIGFCVSFGAGESKSRILINKEIEVQRGDIKAFHFLVHEDEEMEFRGSFKTTGGFNDDINLFVLTQPNYVRWYSRYKCEYALKMRKKKEGKFTVAAEPGETYYFVFENFFSTISNKKVKVKLELVPRRKK